MVKENSMSSEKKPVRYKEPKEIKNWMIPSLVTLLAGFISYYLVLPALNIHNTGFWAWLLFLGIIFTTVSALVSATTNNVMHAKKAPKIVMVPILVVFGIIVILLIGAISSAKIFNAKRFANRITVTTAAFEEDMPETTNVNNIALMDSESAAIIGNRTLGSLSDVVSQFEIAATYSQINYQNTPKKVANLEYADFFKWFRNRKEGIPGFVMVDPLYNSAEYVKSQNKMKYAESAYFSKDLKRALRFAYPTKIFQNMYFEIDDAGNPYYIVSCMKPNAGLFGAMDVNEVIIFNPCDGSSELYALKDVPSWVDIVFDGDLASEKYNWYGMLSGGYLNSLFGNKNCKRVTDDYGYIVQNDDVWYYTGITSVNKDESNIGFILTNARTGEYKFYPVIGAEEYSAMHAAEGEVQEKGYVASFPSLINVDGQATYIMVLKDSGGLVKLYALVNVEKYSIVGIGTTQQEAMSDYKKLLAKNNITAGTPDETAKQIEITVCEIRVVNVDNTPIIYLLDKEGGKAYKGYLNMDESLIMIQEGDYVTLTVEETSVQNIFEIRSWSY